MADAASAAAVYREHKWILRHWYLTRTLSYEIHGHARTAFFDCSCVYGASTEASDAVSCLQCSAWLVRVFLVRALAVTQSFAKGMGSIFMSYMMRRGFCFRVAHIGLRSGRPPSLVHRSSQVRPSRYVQRT